MIEARKSDFISALYIRGINWWLGRNFKEINIVPFEAKPGHSVLMLCNHFSWWESFLSNYVAVKAIKRRWHLMMHHDHALKYTYLRYVGMFSIIRGARQSDSSLTYAAGLLEDQRNLVMMCPQGEIRSNHETHIEIQKGTYKLIQQIKGPCQVIYNCTLIDYFESLKPRAYVHLFDCGIAGEFTFDELKQRVNDFHRQALINQINMKH
jgi:1-acyl-sn-glycerol-3-phosphate acyltransferase